MLPNICENIPAAYILGSRNSASLSICFCLRLQSLGASKKINSSLQICLFLVAYVCRASMLRDARITLTLTGSRGVCVTCSSVTVCFRAAQKFTHTNEHAHRDTYALTHGRTHTHTHNRTIRVTQTCTAHAAACQFISHSVRVPVCVLKVTERVQSAPCFNGCWSLTETPLTWPARSSIRTARTYYKATRLGISCRAAELNEATRRDETRWLRSCRCQRRDATLSAAALRRYSIPAAAFGPQQLLLKERERQLKRAPGKLAIHIQRREKESERAGAGAFKALFAFLTRFYLTSFFVYFCLGILYNLSHNSAVPHARWAGGMFVPGSCVVCFVVACANLDNLLACKQFNRWSAELTSNRLRCSQICSILFWAFGSSNAQAICVAVNKRSSA